LVDIVRKRKGLNLGKVDQITGLILLVLKRGSHSIVEEIAVMTGDVGQVIVLIEGEVDEIEVDEEVIGGRDGAIREEDRQEGEATQGEEVTLGEKATQENVLEDSVDQVVLKTDIKDIDHQVRKMSDQNVKRVKAKASRKFPEVKVILEAEADQNTQVRVNQKKKNQFKVTSRKVDPNPRLKFGLKAI
jgi:hypothetical protein